MTVNILETNKNRRNGNFQKKENRKIKGKTKYN